MFVKTEACDKYPVCPDPYGSPAYLVGEKQGLENFFNLRVKGDDKCILFNFPGTRNSIGQKPDLLKADIVPEPGKGREKIPACPRERECLMFILRRFCYRRLVEQPPSSQ